MLAASLSAAFSSPLYFAAISLKDGPTMRLSAAWQTVHWSAFAIAAPSAPDAPAAARGGRGGREESSDRFHGSVPFPSG